jgi:hypothetical protein
VRSIAFAAVLSVAACTAITDPPVGSLDGRWSGAVGIIEYDAQLAQQGVSLAGTGAIGPTPNSGAEFATRLTTISGTFRAPNVQLTFGSQTGAVAVFSGVLVSTNAIRGTIQTNSPPGTPLTLYRR